MKNLSGLIAFAIVMVVNCVSAFGEENTTLNKSVDWLVSQQDESGAFKSEHYGAMKQGAATTSLALYSLAMTPEKCREENEEAIEKAIAFLMPGTRARGRVANPDGSLDHPVYSTAMFLVAVHRLDHDLDAELLATLLDFLVSSQCVESRGFAPTNPNHGGWDVIGPDVMPGKTSGTNVSVTQFVLEAFSCHVPVAEDQDSAINKATVKRVLKSREQAVTWLGRLQENGAKGGFYFSAQPGSALNKSRSDDDKPQPYASATCDGLLALSFGGAMDSDNFKNASQWIKERTTAVTVGGFENQKDSGWPKALQFYYLQALARSAVSIGEAKKMKKEKLPETMLADVTEVLSKSQHKDGRFENKSSLMRKNDPLIATSSAIIALSSDAK